MHRPGTRAPGVEGADTLGVVAFDDEPESVEGGFPDFQGNHDGEELQDVDVMPVALQDVAWKGGVAILPLEIRAGTRGASGGRQKESIVDPGAGLDHGDAVVSWEKVAPPA